MPTALRRLSYALLLVLVLCFSLTSQADETPSSSAAAPAASARALYDQGKFQEALTQLLNSGLQTSADYYNAGNCLYRLGKLGQALAYYEKAEAMDPSSADIEYNRKLVEETLGRSGGLAKSGGLWLGTIVPLSHTLPEWILNVLLAASTAVLGYLAFRARRQSLRFSQAIVRTGFLVALLVWAGIATTNGVLSIARSTRLAAVIAENATVRSGPSDTFTELSKLPAGTKVEALNEARDGWRQVRFSLGNVGWVVEKDLLEI